MTLNISKRNPLNAIYNYWLYLGGEPKTPEDLCHFMRVCFLWSWVRWLLSFDFEVTERIEGSHGCFDTVSYHQDRLPRLIWFLIATVFIVVGTELYARGIALSVLIMICGIAVVAIFTFGLVMIIGGILGFFKDGDIHEGLRTFRDYASARKQRVCPFIEVEK